MGPTTRGSQTKPLTLEKSAQIVLYASSLRFPNHPAPLFPFYMLILYNRILKSRQLLKIVSVPRKLLQSFLKLTNNPYVDLSNAIIVNKNYLNQQRSDLKEPIVKIAEHRFAYILASDRAQPHMVLLSDDLHHNLGKTTTDLRLRPGNLRVATSLDVSLVNAPHDVGNALIDELLKNYFKAPKLVCKNDLVAVDLERYAPEIFYTSSKVRGVRRVHFRVNRVLVGNAEGAGCFLCAVGETELKQSANVQGFLAPVAMRSRGFGVRGEADFGECLIERCPFGLGGYLEDLEKAVKLFLRENKPRLKPTFLVQGSKGSGKRAIVSNLASKLGLHLYEISASDVTGTAYAQTETKIRNAFFKAKLCTPCVLTINNFENFGKNNEGLHDQRLMSYFRTELENLFQNNSFPLILVCVSNSREVPAELCRVFLEIFDVAAPDANQRCRILQWILTCQNVETQADLEKISGKTHGFLFEDLKALVFYALRNSAKDSRHDLVQSDFDGALDFMQSKYSQSLGAPKIPKVQWSDVGGLIDVKQEIIKTINLPLRHPELLRSTGLKRSGILLYGPPGTGKTLMAKAVATECNLCFLSVKGPELLNMYVGQSEQNVREVFERAREASPCIIFFDELDSLAPNRGISGDSGGVMDRVVSQLLAEMDGLDQSATIFIIGATNRPDLIDPALLRPGRFDKLLYVGPCTDSESKLGVLRALTRKFKFGEDVDLRGVIGLCPGDVTGADLYGLCSSAWMSAVRKLIGSENGVAGLTHEDVLVGLDDFQAALGELKPSIKKDDMVYFENLQRQLGGNAGRSK